MDLKRLVVDDTSRAILPSRIAKVQIPAPAPASNSNGVVSYQNSGQPDNIDERDSDNPLCVTEYVQEMHEYFRSKEELTSIRPGYMENQQFINTRMRSILVDWLVELHLQFKFVPETLYLTVNILDRYLAKKEVTRPKLQLIGVTALLIASKYEEIYPAELRDLVYLCDRAYSKDEVSIILFCFLFPIYISASQVRRSTDTFLFRKMHAYMVRFLKRKK